MNHPPLREPFLINGRLSPVWAKWFMILAGTQDTTGDVVDYFGTPAMAEETGAGEDLPYITPFHEVKESFPLGSIYLNFSGTDPAIELGYGVWQQVAQGLALVGES